MLSIAITFLLVLSHISESILFPGLFTWRWLERHPTGPGIFEFGMYEAFLVSAAITVLAAIISFKRSSGGPRESVAIEGQS